jgi:hypothetical protein
VVYPLLFMSFLGCFFCNDYTALSNLVHCDLVTVTID